MNSRLALGTVQFGLPYGIANQVGQVSEEAAADIVEHAWAAGVDTLDTAMAYGESEQRLGAIGVDQWRVVTKLPAVPESCTDVFAWTQELVATSLQRLRIPRLYGLVLHQPHQLIGAQGDLLYRALLVLKDEGKVEKIGVSIYAPDELESLWSRFHLDIVQAPFNVIDRRLATTGWLTRLGQAGVDIHVRSVFLQGLLLMDKATRPAKFSGWQVLWDNWDNWLMETNLSPLQACLGFALSEQRINRLVLGVDSISQLKAILVDVGTTVEIAPQNLMSDDQNLINPSRWTEL